MTDINVIEERKRSEEVQDIIERVPHNFGYRITWIVVLVFSSLLIFGWLVRYPDVVTGRLTVNSLRTVAKLVVVEAGRLKFDDIRSGDQVAEGQVLAWMDNPANVDDVVLVDSLLRLINISNCSGQFVFNVLPQKYSLGELGPAYSKFLNAAKELANYETNQLFDKQLLALNRLLFDQQTLSRLATEKSELGLSNLGINRMFFSRDSVLFHQKVISKSDLEQSRLKYISAEDQFKSSEREIASSSEQMSQTESKIIETRILKDERESQLNLELLTSYSDLSDQLKAWRQKYLFISPIDGLVQFSNFWSMNQFVPAGEIAFTVVPKEDSIVGQVFLPAAGAGKVKAGQEVIVKLDNYPYLEYGSIKGVVRSISLTPNLSKGKDGDVESYLISVLLPNKLQTNYGSKLEFKYDIKGTAEIVTNDRRLIERFADKLKYILHR